MNKENFTSDNVTFTISQIAKVIGVVPATIRNWETSELFVAKRGNNNYRIYTLDDIESLKRIKQLLDTQKKGGSALKELLPSINSSNPLVNIMDNDKNQTYSKKLLSKKWKEVREHKGYTLEEVSNAVGISPSHLSKLENENANVSLEILNKIALFYGESTVYFFDLDKKETKKIPLGNGEKINLGIPGLDMESLVSSRDVSMYPIMYTVEPGCGNLEPHDHNGEEFIYIISGKIEFTLNNNEKYLLMKNDSFYFKGSETHSWVNPSLKTKAKLLWVHSPYGS